MSSQKFPQKKLAYFNSTFELGLSAITRFTVQTPQKGLGQDDHHPINPIEANMACSSVCAKADLKNVIPGAFKQGTI